MLQIACCTMPPLSSRDSNVRATVDRLIEILGPRDVLTRDLLSLAATARQNDELRDDLALDGMN